MQDKALVLERINGLKELINEKFINNDNAHDAILAQTTKTNGRVTKAEEDIKDINKWKNKIAGALIIANIVLVPLLLLFISLYVKRK